MSPMTQNDEPQGTSLFFSPAIPSDPTAAHIPPPLNYSTRPSRDDLSRPGLSIPPPFNYSTHPSRDQPGLSLEPHNIADDHNPFGEPIKGWEEYDVVDIAEYEYRWALKRYSRLLNRAAKDVHVSDPSLVLAELELKTAARILDQMIDYRASWESIEPIPSPTYSQFSDIPPFLSCPTTPVHQDGCSPVLETPDRLSGTQQLAVSELSSPYPNCRHYSVVVGRRTGVYSSW